MKHCKYFFIVYAIAMLSSVDANAATTVTGLATPEYVKGAINSLPAAARSGSYNDLTNKPSLGTMAAKNNVTNADISGTINQDKINGLTAALDAKQPTLTTGDTGNIKGTGSVTVTKDATSGVITISGTDTKYSLPAANGTTRGGVVTGGDITATNGTLTITDGKVTSAKITDGTIVNDDISASAAIATSKISGLDTALSGKQTTANLVDTTDKIEANKTSTTKYPSMAVAQQMIAKGAGEDVTALKSTVAALETDLDDLAATVEENKGAAQDALDEAIAGLDGKTTGTGTVVKGVSQTDGVVTATMGSITSADITDGTIVAADLALNSVTTAKITNLNVTTDKLAADAVTNAKLADNAVQTENIKDSAVTPIKTSGVIGYIPSGSATSTTYAQIWVQ